ncbi:nitrite reductase large subunit NirB [Oceanospirillum sanctuarii]|uniref:nitrite reductase large subunit NirB n=1 Tax=Oceanospirillum sanctuarii TaxID=1434821 RepID=UPI000A396484|nr:nitrite reductase large subunit NirB [Oceanospirillum sanctuarii]
MTSTAQTTDQTNKAAFKVLVVGNGMVGHHFVESLLEQTKALAIENLELSVFGEEPHRAYDRVHLSEYFTGKDAESLALCESGFYQEEGVRFYPGEKVTTIDRAGKTLTTDKGTSYAYDALVLATGSFPFVPPIPGKDREACLVYRTLEDLDQIRNYAKDGRKGVVIGGGLLGLEAANALRELGLETHVVEFAPRLMPVQLDDEGGAALKQRIIDLGVQVHTSMQTQEIVAGEECRHRMNFADGSHLETDLIVFSAGIRPQDELARSSELIVGERGGIEINSECLTNDPAILAIGECALWNGQIFGLVAPGYQMAKVAAHHILNQMAPVGTLTPEAPTFTGADMSTKLKLLGVDVGSIGDAHARTPGAKTYRYQDEDAQVYRKIVVSENKKELLGAVLVGDNSRYDTLLQYALNGIELPAEPAGLILPESSGAAPALGVDALPDTASICSCLNVTKGQITDAVASGCCSVAEVKDATKASTGCGGCAALLKDVVNAELANQGIEVNTDLCEHFAYTRQELFHLIRVGGIKTFDELLEKHGKGLGCEICKPTAGSILASVWNEHIQEPQHVSLQDTNDTFMANMQKDGTYSVVPRIAGGEITPDKLIVIGEVARDFNLYTKITGGQRVDLFGARLEQLPLIWERLVEAGFETGHAYGKSLRTVKSCVGSTWCRYGVQDSVGMAIRLEDRYKGLRAPHKIKLAVSGCTRECAEAQSKDFGVIATENGWNLYTCGNGGMKPRHADLFATDLNDEELIRIIDRLMMFYVHTGDRLQRTARWMDNMEGGLEYLQNVILHDSLGIAESLEADMQRVVDTYQCEWKSTLENPEKLKRFRPFVNSSAEDPHIQFVEERQQIRPARPEEKVTRLIPVQEVES